MGGAQGPEETSPIEGDGAQGIGEVPGLGTPAAANASAEPEARAPTRLGAGPGGGAARRPVARTRAVLQRFVDDDEGYQQWVSDHPDGYVLHTSRGSRGQPLMLHRPNCKIISGVNEDGSEMSQANLKLASTSPDPIESWCQQIMRSEPDLCEECMG